MTRYIKANAITSLFEVAANNSHSGLISFELCVYFNVTRRENYGEDYEQLNNYWFYILNNNYF